MEEYVEENIIIDGSPFNRLQVYKMEEMPRDSKKQHKKARPCILIQESAASKYYDKTKLIAIPMSTTKNKIKVYKANEFVVERIVIGNKMSKFLIFNTATRTESEIKKWYDNKEEVFIKKEDKIKIIEKMEEYNMKILEFEDEAFGRKSIYQELKEGNAELRQSNAELRQSDAELKQSNAELRQSNAELKQSNAELSQSNKELIEKVNKIVKLMEKR